MNAFKAAFQKEFGIPLPPNMPIVDDLIPVLGDLTPYPDGNPDKALFLCSRTCTEVYMNTYTPTESWPKGYFLIGFWGHGVNSYAFYYSRIDSWSKVFFRLRHDGTYSNIEEDAGRIREFLPRYFDFEERLVGKVRSLTATDQMGTGYYKVVLPDRRAFEHESFIKLPNFETEFSDLISDLDENIAVPDDAYGKDVLKEYRNYLFVNDTSLETDELGSSGETKLERPTHSESSSSSENEPLNVMGLEWDSETRSRWQGKFFLSPEDYVGATYTENRIRYRIDSIAARDGFSVVLNIVNLETGREEITMKLIQSFFDLEATLQKRINRAVQSRPYDPDRVIHLCDKLLEIDPNEDFAAFNKGAAFEYKGEIEQALEWYDVATTCEPEDFLNQISRAAALAKLKRHFEALEAFLVASRLNPNSVKIYLKQVQQRRELFEVSFKWILETSPENKDAQEALNELFLTNEAPPFAEAWRKRFKRAWRNFWSRD